MALICQANWLGMEEKAVLMFKVVCLGRKWLFIMALERGSTASS